MNFRFRRKKLSFSSDVFSTFRISAAAEIHFCGNGGLAKSQLIEVCEHSES